MSRSPHRTVPPAARAEELPAPAASGAVYSSLSKVSSGVSRCDPRVGLPYKRFDFDTTAPIPLFSHIMLLDLEDKEQDYCRSCPFHRQRLVQLSLPTVPLSLSDLKTKRIAFSLF